MTWIKSTSQYVLAIFMIGAGTMHFVKPDFFLKIVPPYLPLPEVLVFVSGICGTNDRSPASTSVARRVHSLGVLAYTKNRTV